MSRQATNASVEHFSSGTSRRCGEDDHSVGDHPSAQNTRITCRRCEGRGHRARDCPSRASNRIVCYRCRGCGHRARNCPSPRSTRPRRGITKRRSGLRRRTSSRNWGLSRCELDLPSHPKNLIIPFGKRDIVFGRKYELKARKDYEDRRCDSLSPILDGFQFMVNSPQ